MQAAQVDPAVAAQMLSLAPPGAIQPNIAGNIASGWSQSDLSGAARWALGLSDTSARSIAISTVGSSWAYRDPAAAQRWAANLPNGEARDQALTAVLSRLSRNGFDTAIDLGIMDAFDSTSTRNRLASEIVATVAANDPDRAARLMDRWITDAALRQQAREAIERARESF
jgi:hypothetical protein